MENNLQIKPIYNYFANSLSEAKGLWLSLAQKKEELFSTETQNEIELLNEILNSEKTDSFTAYYKGVIASVDLGLLRSCIQPEAPEEKLKELENKIMQCYAVVFGYPELPILSPEELQKIFSGEKTDVSNLVIHNTLREIILDNYDNRRSYYEAVFPFLGIEQVARDRDNLSWGDSLILAQMLHLAWRFFSQVEFADKKYLMINYLYLSVAVGAPVKEMIIESLYTAVDWQIALFLYGLFIKCIEELKEEIPVPADAAGGLQYKPLKNIFGVFYNKISSNKQKDIVKDSLNLDYAEEIYSGMRQRDSYVRWLREILYLLYNLRTGKLVEDIRLDEIDQDRLKFRDDMEDLLGWLINKQWEEIAKYYSKPSFGVPLKVFFTYLTNFYDINKEETVSFFLKFTDYLHQNKILADNVDIVEFSEGEGKFAWNLDFIYDYAQ